MDIRELKRLLAAVAEADVSEFTLEQADYKISLKRGQVVVQGVQQAAPLQVQQPSETAAQATPEPTADTRVAAALDPQLQYITAPIVGTFSAAPTPDAPNYVKV